VVKLAMNCTYSCYS